MAKYVIQTDKGAPPLGAYSQGWRAGDFIFVTGSGPIGLDGKVKGTTIEEQAEQVIDNVEAILRADGAAQELVRACPWLLVEQQGPSATSNGSGRPAVLY